MKRKKISLSNEQWRDLIYETYLKIEDKEVPIEEIENNYDGSSRHTEEHHIIFRRVEDNKFFKINYENSVKDTMGWEECNYGETNAIEVFPEMTTITKYK